MLLGAAAIHVARGHEAPGMSIRVNPDVLAGGHPHIATGRHEHKFGLDWKEARRLYLLHRNAKWIRWRGISAHIGSQIVTVPAIRTSVETPSPFLQELKKQGLRCATWSLAVGWASAIPMKRFRRVRGVCADGQADCRPAGPASFARTRARH